MPNQLANIHDGFFKQVLGNPQLADTFLREHLPPDTLVILKYLNEAAVGIDHKIMRETLLQHAPDRAERIMGCLTQPFYEKGKSEGEAKILTRLLEKRFGVVPPLLRERIFAANVGQIEAWVERVLDAPDLHAVFESN